MLKPLLLGVLLTCGLTPLKPLPPLGCKDLLAVCICDEQGRCRWQWQCVR